MSFRELLEKELGYNAVAPFSGTEYDLLTGEPITITEGVLIPDKSGAEHAPGSKAERLYNDLVTAAAELAELSKNCKGRTNAEITTLTERIRNLIEYYK